MNLKIKKSIKTIIILAISIALFTCFLIVANAVTDPVYYTITTKDGTVSSYTNSGSFVENVKKANDGDTIKLNRSIEITSSLNFKSTKNEPRIVNIDLAGNGIYCRTKLNMFEVGAYTTVNVYSSEEDAFLYVVESTTSGGSMFFINGDDARLNFGTMLVDGVIYPGSNITTFSSSVINVQGSKTVGFFGDGGTHFANIADWNGFICLRSGSGYVEAKNMNFVTQNNSYFIYAVAETKASLYLEKCTIIRADGQDKDMFNHAYGQMTFKDCVTNYSYTVGTTSYGSGNVKLLGTNIVGAGKGINKKLVAGTEDLSLARINYDYTFVGGAKSLWYYDINVKFNKLDLKMPDSKAYVLVPEDSTVEYTWITEEEQITEVWKVGEEPLFPLELEGSYKTGVYKPHWKKVEEGRNITYYGGLGLDFNIKVGVEDGRYLCMAFYIPAHIVSEGYLDFSLITLNGESYGKSMWSLVNIDGEEYYKATTLNIEDASEEKFSLTLVCTFDARTTADSTWTVSIPEYVATVLANSESYTEEEIEFVRNINSEFLGNQIFN